MGLTDEQRARCDRNTRIAGIGEAGQQRLDGSRELAVGPSGQGSPAAPCPAAAGEVKVGLLDCGLAIDCSANSDTKFLLNAACLRVGRLFAAAGVLGSLEALEIIRCRTGLWKAPADARGLVRALDDETPRLSTIRIPRRLDCPCAALWSDR